MTKPLRADARRNRDALLAKARELFADGHFDMRFDDFAKLAGVGTGTLYRHFPTREALAEAVYREELAAICAHGRELRATRPAADALAAFLRGFVTHLHNHQGLARTLATLMAAREGTLAEGGQELTLVISELLAAGVEQGTIRADVGAGAVMLTLQGLCAAHDQPHARTDADGAITLVLDGLRRD
ncbi:TetR/AcrR family transcriptional regulator [Actinoplanes sp. NPDC049596]|uniref:TetR/AcrR family transcriptional regulator n=1 Tax=unclassified Actinoplanes TaxID=2626549 RepID=UPI00344A139B